MNLKNIFSGLEFGSRQKVGVMSVIPLISQKDATDNLASFKDIKFERTADYGHMVFQNSSDKSFILPSGYSIITKQAAQDHATTYATLLRPNNITSVRDACCIEQTQGGYIDGTGVNDFKTLPLYVRKKHINNVIPAVRSNTKKINPYFEDSFSRLWPIISEFQNKLIKENIAHLVFFFNKFVEQLNKFNAEFEVVPNQRGAIILINDKIVGIEIAPTVDYWKHIWNSLIRDCYGSEVIRLTYSNLIKEFEKHQKQRLELGSASSLQDIKRLIEDYDIQEKLEIQHSIDQFTEQEVLDMSDAKSFMDVRSNNQFKYNLFRTANHICGEIYTENENVVYASVLF